MAMTNGRKDLAKWVAALTSGTILTPVIAEAQIDVITVTATKREASLQDVPVAVTAVSGEQLENSGAFTIESLATIAPSVTFTQSSNDLNNAVNIRGIGTSVFSQGVEPSVSVVVDDVVMGRQGMGFQDLIDIEQVEVLRGPQSTLFGKNASAGVIAVTTKAPTDEFSATLDTMYAEGGEYAVRGTVSGPIGDRVGARLTGFVREFDGHIDNLATEGQNDDRLNGFENWGLRGKILFEPSDATDVTVIADYRRTVQDCCIYTVRDTGNAQGAAAGGALDALLAPVVPGEENAQVRVGAPVFNKSDQGGVSVKAEHAFDNEYTLTSITAYRNWDFSNNLDVDNLDLEEPRPGFITFDLNSGTTQLDQWSQEVRLTSPSYDRFDFMLGVFAFQLDLDRTFARRFEIAIPLGGDNILRINQSGQFASAVKTTNISGFASGNYYVAENLTMFGGLRLISEELDYTVLRDPADVLAPGDRPFGGNNGQPADIDDTTDDMAVTGEVGVRYDIGSRVQTYARCARGYKGRAIDVGFGVQEGIGSIDPEISNAFEVGLKSRFWDGKALLNVALFHTTFDDFQEQATRILPDGDGVLNAETVLTNVGTVETSGVEIETVVQPTDLTTIRAGLSYTDASIEEFDGAPCYFGQTAAEGCVPNELGVPVQDLAGGDLPNAPDWRLTGSVRQIVPFGGVGFDGFVQADGVWQSEANFSLNQDPRAVQEDYAIVNLSLGIEDDQGRYSASLFVNNLFDQFYTTNVFGDPLYGGVVSQFVPRNFERYMGGRVRVSF